MTSGRTIVQRVLGQIKLGRPEPIWFDVVARMFPPLHLTKPASQGINLGEYEKKTKPSMSPYRVRMDKGKEMKKEAAIKHGRPPKLQYPEDGIRERFFREHPAEARRPISLSEGLAGQVDSEFVVQRHSELKEQLDSDEAAYQQALKDFYAERERQEVSEVSALRQDMQTAGKDPQQMLDEAFNKVAREQERLAEIEAKKKQVLSNK